MVQQKRLFWKSFTLISMWKIDRCHLGHVSTPAKHTTLHKHISLPLQFAHIISFSSTEAHCTRPERSRHRSHLPQQVANSAPCAMTLKQRWPEAILHRSLTHCTVQEAPSISLCFPHVCLWHFLRPRLVLTASSRSPALHHPLFCLSAYKVFSLDLIFPSLLETHTHDWEQRVSRVAW